MTPQDIIDNWCSEWRVVDRDRLLADIKQVITEAVEEERLRQMTPMECGHPLACFSPWGGAADNLPKPPGSLSDCLECRGILAKRRACAEIVRNPNIAPYTVGARLGGDTIPLMMREHLAQAIEARGKKA